MDKYISELLIGLLCFIIIPNMESVCGKSMIIPRSFKTTHGPRLHNINRFKRSVSAGMPMKKVGRCNVDDVRSNGSHCMGLLYKTSDGKPVTSCRSKVPLFVQCTANFFTKCLTGLIGEDKILMTLEGVELGLTSSPVVMLYCDDGAVERKAPTTLTQFCLPALKSEYVKCSKKFHESFDKNRADLNLCSLFKETNACLLKSLLTNCNLPIVTSAVNLEKASLQNRPNPYCYEDAGKLQPGSGDKPDGDINEGDEGTAILHSTPVTGTEKTVMNTDSKPIKNDDNNDNRNISVLYNSSWSLMTTTSMFVILLTLK